MDKTDYLKRKIDNLLIGWKADQHRLPALVVGIRQCGKTSSIMNFANANYGKVIYLNFMKEPKLRGYFEGSLDPTDLMSRLSLENPGFMVVPGNTLLFLDEIQDCPRAHLFFKFAAGNPSFDVIGSGPYLGISGYAKKDGTPLPVGYETIMEMSTMDFEEFLWAKGYDNAISDTLYASLKNGTPINEGVHERLKRLFLDYMIVGGFPKAIKDYLDSGTLAKGLNTTKANVKVLKRDFGRRIDTEGNPVFNNGEVALISKCFDLMTTFMKDGSRFIVSKIGKGRPENGKSAIDYLEDSGICRRVYNLTNLSLPLSSCIIEDRFKLFPTDIGILSALEEDGFAASLVLGRGGTNLGYFYEGAVFDSLLKAGFKPFYLKKNSGLELDFVISLEGDAHIIEAKTKGGYAKSAKTVLAHPEHYGKAKLIKIGDYNVGRTGDVLTIPHYMCYLLGRLQSEYVAKALSS